MRCICNKESSPNHNSQNFTGFFTELLNVVHVDTVKLFSDIRDLTLYVPIIAILDIWKTTCVFFVSFISLPVHILYDNPHIFFKLINIVSF